MSETQTCQRGGCQNPAGRRLVILIEPPHRGGGDIDDDRSRRYCEPCTDALLGNLGPTYTDGGPAYRIEETPR